VGRSLSTVGIRKAEDIVAHYLFGRDAILDLAGDVERNTDDNRRIEYSAPLHLFEETRVANDQLLLGRAEVPFAAVEGASGLFALTDAYFGIGSGWEAVLTLAAVRRLAGSGDPAVDGMLALIQAQADALRDGDPIPPPVRRRDRQ
jgi:hypothetical protein